MVLRGMRATCAVCGAPRSPLDAVRAVNVAGRPARFGGELGRVLGVTVLLVGLTLALVVGGVAQALFPGSPAGLVLGVPIGLLTIAMAVALLFGARRLRTTGETRARAAQIDAIFSLAEARGGELEAHEVARAIDVPELEADALLTELAKMPEGRVELEVDDQGRLKYRFPEFLEGARRVSFATDLGARVRVAPAADGGRAEADREHEAELEADAERRPTRLVR
ncbi:MAG TPA: hypothetical protein VHB21_16685 [Minicystis sp.]|nr:hypothetical protein [Minicystis sp.]